MDLLARREHAFHELLRKISLKGYDKEAIEPVLLKLVQEGLLNDSRFIENFIQFRRNKGFGPLRILNELLEKGISAKSIEEHLDITDNAWHTLAALVRQKRFKNRLPPDFKSRAKEMRFLQYRGFTQDQIKRLFRSDDNDA